MSKALNFTFILLLLLFSFPSFAGEPCTSVSGKVQSKGKVVPFATIQVSGINIGTVADLQGHWTLSQLPQSKVRVKVQSIGYEPLEKEIDCSSLQGDVIFELLPLRIGLNEVVVTGSRYEVSRSEASVIVNVLRPEMLKSAGAVCLSDGLSFTPGLRVENNCQNCGFQQVRINGLEGPYSQILIDSRPIISALSGVYGIEQIPLAMIDRVEVVRGGGSALYGSNAIAGTINIITREPLKNHVEATSALSLIAGKVQDKNFGFNVTLVNEERTGGMSLFASTRNRGHWDANGDGFSEIGLIEAKSLGIRSYWKPGSKGKLTASYHYIDEFRRGGNKFDLQPHETDITEQTDHKIHGGELVFDLFKPDGKGKSTVYASAQHILRHSYYGAGQDPYAYGKTNDLTFVAGTQWYRQLVTLSHLPVNLVAGAEWQLNEMHDQMPGYERDLNQHINIAGIYGQAELKHSRASLLLGMRADRHNLIAKPIISPRLTLLTNLNTGTQWRTSFSTGFRAPQAFDEDLHIIAVNGGVMLIRLHPGLRPEYSQSLSSSIETNTSIRSTPINAVAEIFYTRLQDVFVLETLETDANGNMIVERRNGSGARVMGLNLEQRIEIGSKTSIQSGLTLQRSRYFEPEVWSEDPEAKPLHQLPKSPDVYGYANVNRVFSPGWSQSLSLKYTGPMKALHFAGFVEKDQIKDTPAFLELDLRTSYTINLSGSWQMKLEAGVQNLMNSFQRDFDEGMFRDAGYMYGPMRPRTYFLGLKINSI